MFREGRGGSKAVLDISARKTCKMFKKCAKRAERAKVCKKWRSVQIYENLHTKNLQKYTKDWKKRANGYERLQKNVQMCTIGCKKTCRCIRKVAKKPADVNERLQKNLQMYTKGCKKTCICIRKVAKKPADVYERLQKNLQKYTKDWEKKTLQMYTKGCKNCAESAKVCKNVPKFTKVRKSRLNSRATMMNEEIAGTLTIRSCHTSLKSYFIPEFTKFMLIFTKEWDRLYSQKEMKKFIFFIKGMAQFLIYKWMPTFIFNKARHSTAFFKNSLLRNY